MSVIIVITSNVSKIFNIYRFICRSKLK